MKKNMDINRETAKRLWNKFYGKKLSVVDFSGREMKKSAYNDRNSNYGWNLDHILPQSKGGKNVDHNLVCTNILTNDEKANKFPCFTANGKKFEIIKVQNHYEIKQLNAESKSVEEDFNFYDSASGIRFFKKVKGIQNKKPFVGVVNIELDGVTSLAIVDFIQNQFEIEDLVFTVKKHNYFYGESSYNVNINVVNRNIETKKGTQDLLDDCVLLNTWFQYYFKEIGVIKDSSIYYELVKSDDKVDALTYNTDKIFSENLVINENVRINTYAKEKHDETSNGLYVHDYHFVKLKKNLEKETGR